MKTKLLTIIAAIPIQISNLKKTVSQSLQVEYSGRLWSLKSTSQNLKNSSKTLVSSLIYMTLLLSGYISWGQISLSGGSISTAVSTNTTNNTTLTIPKPSSLAIGDIMIVQVVQSGNNNTSSIGDATGTGWTAIAGSNIRASFNNYSRATLLYKIATSTDVTSANFSFNLDGNSDDGEGGIIAFTGVDNANPFDVTPANAYTNISNDQTLNASAITTANSGTAIIMFGAIHDNVNVSSWTTASPGSLTLTELYDEDFNATIDTGMGAAWATKATSGSTGAGTAAISGGSNVYNGSILIALKKGIPTITGLGSSSGCISSSITINGTNLSGATSVKIGGTAASITSNTATQIIAVVGAGTTGTVSVTNAGGTATSTATFTVNPMPAVAAMTTTACSGAGFTSTPVNGTNGTVPAGTTYSWSAPAVTGGITGGASGSATTITGVLTNPTSTAQTATYTVTPTSGTCTGATFTITATVNPLPQGSLAANGPFCATGAGQLTWTATAGTGPYIIIYNDGVANRTQNNITSGTSFATFATPVTNTTTYTLVSVAGANTCARTTGFTGSSGSITVNALPSAPSPVTALPTAICNGSPSNLNATSAGNTIKWYTVASGGTAIATSASGANFPVTPTTTTTYYVETLTGTGCVSSTRISTTVTVNPLPSSPTSATASSSTICNGSSSNLSATSAGNTINWYTSASGGSASGASPSGANFSVSPTSTTTYYSETLTGVGCVSATRTSVTVTVNPTNTVTTVSSPLSLCINSSSSNVTHNTTGATGIGTATGLPTGLSATWASNKITLSGTPTQAGSFNYSVPLSGGCGSVNATGTINIDTMPVITDQPDDYSACSNGNAYFSIVATGSNLTYQWQYSTNSGNTWIAITTVPFNNPLNWNTGEVSPNLTVITMNIPSSTDGYLYRCVVSNGSCSVTSNSAILHSNLNSSVGTPSFSLGATSSRCQGAGTVTYTATASNTTGITYSLNATSLAAGNSINSSTGVVTYVSGYSGSSIITASATGCNGPLTASHTATITSTVGIPTANAGMGATCNQITANWAVNANTTGYYLDVSTVNTFASFVGVYNNLNVTNVTAKTITSLTAGTTYYYRVRAYNTCGTSSSSNSISYATSPAIPSAPTASAGTAGTCAQITANWTASTNAIGYYLDVSTANTFASFVGVYNNLDVGSATTINVTNLTAGTTYYYRVRAYNTCGTSVSSNTISYTTPSNTVGLASSTPSLCLNTALTPITHLTSGATGIGVAIGLPTGATAAWASNTITISGAPSASGVFYYSIPLIGGCGNVNATGTITVNNLPAAPTIGTISQPTCITTGGAILNGLPSGNWTINPGNITGTGSSATVSGLPSGTTNFTATDNFGCISPQSEDVIISGTNIKRWVGSATATGSDWFDGSNWIPVGAPTANDCVVIPNNVPEVLISDTSKTAYANSLTVSSAGYLDVKAGNILVVTDFVNVDPGGTLTLQDSANLIQINNANNLGAITAIRNTTPIVLNDYTYWSSPTSGSQTLSNFSPHSNPKYFLAYSNGWKYLDASNTVFDKGIGYAIVSPKGTSSTAPSSTSFQFKGTPNNGAVTVPVEYDASSFSSELIGNPYPSALDADKFIIANLEGTGTMNKTITGTLYFWTHNHSFSNGTYTSDDYATYNLTGGTGTGKSALGSGSGAGNSTQPQRWIASGQGFIVETKTNGNVTFANDMRTTGTNYVNTNFYKNANIANTETSLEKNRIWLNLTNDTSNFSQTLIGYIETATNSYDPGFDGNFNSTGKIGLYSLIANNSFTIQGRAIPFSTGDVVPLGYKTDANGNMTIGIDNVDGLFSGNQDIFIEDKLLNVIHNLKLTPYIFSSEAGTFNSRFVLRYSDATLGLNAPKDISNNILITSKNQQIKIQSTGQDISKVFVYDMLGRTIYKNSEIDNKETLISDLKTQEVLIVKVVLANGETISNKVVNQ